MESLLVLLLLTVLLVLAAAAALNGALSVSSLLPAACSTLLLQCAMPCFPCKSQDKNVHIVVVVVVAEAEIVGTVGIAAEWESGTGVVVKW